MASTFVELFDQIVHSERCAQERKSILNEVKSQILQAEEKLSELKKEYDALKGELVIKIQQLNEEELSCKWVKNRESILSDQWSQIKQTKEELVIELGNLQDKQMSGMNDFCQKVKTFAMVYDLCEQGQAKRQQEAQKAVESLSQQENQLQEIVGRFESRKKAVQQLKSKVENYKKQLNELNQQSKDTRIELEKEKKKTESLLREKERITKVPQQDPEFQRLHKEIEENRPEHLEEQCYELQKQVQHLQQKLWQKQVKQRQQSFKQQSTVWQQQQDVQHKQQHQDLQQCQQKRKECDDGPGPPKCNRVCLTNYSSSGVKNTSSNTENVSADQVPKESYDDLSQEDLNEIFNDDMANTEINRQKKIFKPRPKSQQGHS